MRRDLRQKARFAGAPLGLPPQSRLESCPAAHFQTPPERRDRKGSSLSLPLLDPPLEIPYRVVITVPQIRTWNDTSTYSLQNSALDQDILKALAVALDTSTIPPVHRQPTDHGNEVSIAIPRPRRPRPNHSSPVYTQPCLPPPPHTPTAQQTPEAQTPPLRANPNPPQRAMARPLIFQITMASLYPLPTETLPRPQSIACEPRLICALSILCDHSTPPMAERTMSNTFLSRPLILTEDRSWSTSIQDPSLAMSIC